MCTWRAERHGGWFTSVQRYEDDCEIKECWVQESERLLERRLVLASSVERVGEKRSRHTTTDGVLRKCKCFTTTTEGILTS